MATTREITRATAPLAFVEPRPLLPRPRSSAGRERGSDDPRSRFVYWHRDLPPLDSDILGEHVLEAKSDRVAGSIEHDGDLWDRCHGVLLEHATARLAQEVARLGGDYAHVLDEHIDSRRDDLTNESWLQGRFNYVLYRRRAQV